MQDILETTSVCFITNFYLKMYVSTSFKSRALLFLPISIIVANVDVNVTKKARE